jgi:hypothetical protein
MRIVYRRQTKRAPHRQVEAPFKGVLMSTQSVVHVLQHVQVPSPEKFVLVVLAWHACKDHHIAWPSEATLAKETSMTVRGVHRIIRKLEQKGLIRVWRKVRPRGGHRYFIVTDDRQSPVNSVTGDHGCEPPATQGPPKEILKREKECARAGTPNPGLLAFLGLQEGSEVYRYCLNGHTAQSDVLP